jgi:hypothetical protein
MTQSSLTCLATWIQDPRNELREWTQSIYYELTILHGRGDFLLTKSIMDPCVALHVHTPALTKSIMDLCV